MTIKAQTHKRLELEERLIRINLVLKQLSKEITLVGPRVWQIEDIVEKEDDGFEFVVVEDKAFYYEDVKEIKEYAMEVLMRMTKNGLRGSEDPVISQKWEGLVAIYRDADRLLRRRNLEDRMNRIEEERKRILTILERKTVSEVSKKGGVLENRRMKLLVNKYRQNHKDCTVEQAFFAVSLEEVKEFEAVKRGYYYKGKK